MANINKVKLDFDFSTKNDWQKNDYSKNNVIKYDTEMQNNLLSSLERNYVSYNDRVKLPYGNGIFGPDAIVDGTFGGNQGNLYRNIDEFILNRKIRDIVWKYYPDADSEDLELLFYRMNKVGCGYVAAINTLLFQAGIYPGCYNFDTTFDYPYLGKNGYCSDYLFLDFFLYYAKEHEGYKTIEEVYGNAAEQMQKTTGVDAALSDDEFKITGMDGTFVDIVAETMKDFLKSKGINIEVYDKINMSKEQKIKYIEDAINQGKAVNEELFLRDDYEFPITSEQAIELVMNDINLIMNVSADNFPLYSPEDKDGNGKFDDITKSNVGGHIMTVVGVVDGDPSKIVVSSWGKEYVMDVADINDYVIYDYSEANGAESSIHQ